LYKSSYKGLFRPKNPEKYIGDANNIVFRSLLERNFMRFCDHHPSVVAWASEEMFIPYRSPIDGKIHRYFPDFFVKLKQQDGSVRSVMVEVKPSKFCQPPTPPKSKRNPGKRFLKELQQWGVNEAKWNSAKQICDKKGWEFQILTEKELSRG
jgi:hypothetical protein